MKGRTLGKIIAVTVFLLVAFLVVGLIGAGEKLSVATHSVSHSLCTAAFVSKVDPVAVFHEEQEPSMRQIAWAIRYDIDRQAREVRSSVLGGWRARAVYREGLGCMLVHGDRPVAQAQGFTDAPIASPWPPESQSTDNSRLRAALDLAFSEPNPSSPRHTKAVVVVHDGKLIAERYAPGYGPDTPIWAHSLTKSVMNALAGILVQQGQLRVDQAAFPHRWPADDPRSAVTIDQLMRMTSGLPFDETDGPVSPMTKLFFLSPDMAAYASSVAPIHPPGQNWAYSNLGYVLLAQALMDAAQARDAIAAERFMRDALFRPLGMGHTLVETDEVGTPVGSSHTYGTARDFARFGQLYLDDGVIDGRRLLPEGWAAYSHAQTLDTGYGAGFWTNLRQEGSVPVWDVPWGMPQLPRDTYFARGALGQYIMIVPSERLVVVRMGISVNSSTDIANFTAAVIAGLHGGQQVEMK